MKRNKTIKLSTDKKNNAKPQPVATSTMTEAAGGSRSSHRHWSDWSKWQ